MICLLPAQVSNKITYINALSVKDMAGCRIRKNKITACLLVDKYSHDMNTTYTHKALHLLRSRFALKPKNPV